jgi:hypothetical protein
MAYYRADKTDEIGLLGGSKVIYSRDAGARGHMSTWLRAFLASRNMIQAPPILYTVFRVRTPIISSLRKNSHPASLGCSDSEDDVVQVTSRKLEEIKRKYKSCVAMYSRRILGGILFFRVWLSLSFRLGIINQVSRRAS